MTRNAIALSAATAAGQAPGLLTGSLSIASVEESPAEYELQVTVEQIVEQLGAGILRLALVDSTTAEATPIPVCMINVEGPIGGPPGTMQSEAPGQQYSQSWTQSDVPGVRFGQAGALLQVMCYESDSEAVISAMAVF
jgi:hypothetical protein